MSLALWDILKPGALSEAGDTEDQVLMEIFKFELDQFNFQLMYVVVRQLDGIEGIDKDEIIRLIFVPILYMVELPKESEVSDGLIRYAKIFHQTKMNPAESIFDEVRTSKKAEAIRIKSLIKSWVDDDLAKPKVLLAVCNVLYLLHDCLKSKQLERN